MAGKNYDYWFRRTLADLRAQEAAIKRHRVRLVELHALVEARLGATDRGIATLHAAIKFLDETPNLDTHHGSWPLGRRRGRPFGRKAGRPPDSAVLAERTLERTS